MNIVLEILDTLFLIGFIVFVVLSNKRQPGSWWKVGLASIAAGAIIGFALSWIFPAFDADLFPLLVLFVASDIWYLRIIYLERQ